MSREGARLVVQRAEGLPCTLFECDPSRRYPIEDFVRFGEIKLPSRKKEKRVINAGSRKDLADSVEKSSSEHSRRNGSYRRLLAFSKTALSGDRSKRDFALICKAIEEGLEKENVWQDVQNFSKFADRGREYFDTTWDNARMNISHQNLENAVASETFKADSNSDDTLGTDSEKHSSTASAADPGKAPHSPDDSAKSFEKIFLEANKDCHSSVVSVSGRLHIIPSLYQQAGSLFFSVKPEGSEIEGLKPVTAPVLSTLVTSIAQFVHTTEKGSHLVQPPPSIVRSIMAHESFPNVPIVDQIANGPTMTRQGKLLLLPGYDKDSKTYGAFKPLPIDFKVPESPTKSDAIAAAHRLLSLVGDFPFLGPADLSAWLALILTIVLRPALLRVPIFLFNANSAGTGKSMLANLAVTIATGSPTSPVDYSADNDKMEKLITALLSESKVVCDFDNIPNGTSFGSAVIDRLVTADSWTGRILGSTKSISVANKITVIASGNNLSTAPDTTRRVIVCRLRTDRSAPADRTDFEVPDLAEHVRENRQRFLADALTLLVAHIRDGCPGIPGAMGSFQQWYNRVIALVGYLGLQSPLDSTRAERSLMNTEHLEAVMLLDSLASIFGTKSFRARDVVELMANSTHKHRQKESIDTLAEILSGREINCAKAVGCRFKQLKDQWFERGEHNRKLIGEGQTSGSTRWRIDTRVVDTDDKPSDQHDEPGGGQGGQGGHMSNARSTPWNPREYIKDWYNRMRSSPT